MRRKAKLTDETSCAFKYTSKGARHPTLNQSVTAKLRFSQGAADEVTLLEHNAVSSTK
jgi:hypothetical protein